MDRDDHMSKNTYDTSECIEPMTNEIADMYIYIKVLIYAHT